MDAKSYLKRLQQIDEIIRLKMEQKEDLRHMKITVSYSDLPAASSNNDDKIGEIVVKISELEDEINEYIDKLIDLKVEASRLLRKLGARENVIMEMRYLQNHTWPYIADALGYELRNLHKIHSKALCQLNNIMQKEEGL